MGRRDKFSILKNSKELVELLTTLQCGLHRVLSREQNVEGESLHSRETQHAKSIARDGLDVV